MSWESACAEQHPRTQVCRLCSCREASGNDEWAPRQDVSDLRGDPASGQTTAQLATTRGVAATSLCLHQEPLGSSRESVSPPASLAGVSAGTRGPGMGSSSNLSHWPPGQLLRGLF